MALVLECERLVYLSVLDVHIVDVGIAVRLVGEACEDVDIGFKGVNKGTKDQYADNGFAFLEGGTMDVTTTGEATRGVKADSTILVAGITATVRTTGNACYDATKNDISSAAAIKTGGAFSMTSGTLTLSSTGSGGPLCVEIPLFRDLAQHSQYLR